MSFSLLSALLLAVCAFHVGTATDSDQAISADEYSVYSVVLEQLYTSNEIRLLVIEDQTDKTSVYFSDSSEPEFEYLNKHFPMISTATIYDYTSKNNDSQPLSRAFHLNTSYVLLSRKEFKGFAGEKETMEMSRDGWTKFYNDYPMSAGLISISRVGFDDKRAQALVYVSLVRGHDSGRMWGDGGYVLLIKRKGVWRVRKQATIWVH